MNKRAVTVKSKNFIFSSFDGEVALLSLLDQVSVILWMSVAHFQNTFSFVLAKINDN